MTDAADDRLAEVLELFGACDASHQDIVIRLLRALVGKAKPRKAKPATPTLQAIYDADIHPAWEICDRLRESCATWSATGGTMISERPTLRPGRCGVDSHTIATLSAPTYPETPHFVDRNPAKL